MDTQVTPSAILVAQVIEIEQGGSVESIKVDHPPTAFDGWFVVTGVYWKDAKPFEIKGFIDPEGKFEYLLSTLKPAEYDPFKGLEI